MKRKPIIAGNWKMYKTIPEALALVNGLMINLKDVMDRDIVVCPPFTAIKPVSDALKGSNILIGAQDVFWEEKGAFTGEVSPNMLVDAGSSYVIIGHSERRQYFAETDETVNKKIKGSLKVGLMPIVCVGETLKEREQNIAYQIVERQTKNALLGLSKQDLLKIIIAYEPVWAIGTGKTATPQQAEDMHRYIRGILKDLFGQDISESIRIIYGGSIKPENISELMKQPDIDGGLVGGASLDIDSFTKIVCFI